ncbi:MAG TPA: hypothetical protein VF105_07290 [Gemmatimonadaceae bacterium]
MQATPKAAAQAGADVAPQAKAPTVRVFTDAGTEVLHIPTSHEEMNALMSRRRQLSDQLENVTDRRRDLIEQYRTAPAIAEPGMRAQLAALDTRVVQLENDLATTGREIAGASPELISMTEERRSPQDDNGSFDDGVGAGVAGTLSAVFVLFFFARRWWMKSGRRRAQPLMLNADSERLQRLETGMEAMAIEIERISEGQRFVTKLLSESRQPESAPR